MPNADESGGTPDLEEHPLVQQARSPGERGEPTARIIGFLGRDTEPGYWRVYFTPQLKTYVRVPEGDILSNRAHATETGPLARTVIQVKNVTNLEQVTPLPRQLQAGFLGGNLVSSLTAAGPTTPPTQASLATTLPCIAIGTIILVTISPEQNPPPPPTHPDTSMASCCLCWTPEPTCPTPPL